MDFSEIEQKYFQLRPDLYRFVLSQTLDRDLTEDTMQEIIMELIRVYRQGTMIREDTFRGFLYTIAYSKIKQQKNKKMKEPGSFLQGPDSLVSPRKKRDESYMIYSIVHNVLDDETLPNRTRLALRLRLLEKLAVEEILQALEISRQTYYRDIRIGLDVLRRALEAKGLTPEDLE